jgi:hypothetical protein
LLKLNAPTIKKENKKPSKMLAIVPFHVGGKDEKGN